MKKFFFAITLCVMLGCGGGQKTQSGTGPSWITLYEGGKIVGIWKAFDVVHMSANRVEFINEQNQEYLIVNGTFIVAPCREPETKYVYTRQEI